MNVTGEPQGRPDPQPVSAADLLGLLQNRNMAALKRELKSRQRRLLRYEARTMLDHDQFRGYVESKTHFEEALQLLIAYSIYSMEYGEAMGFIDTVRSVNTAALQIARNELERVDPAPSDDYRAELERAAAEAQGLVLLMQGQELATEAEHHQRLLDHPQGALQAFSKAQEYFERLADSGLPQRFEGAVRARMCAYMGEVVIGVGQLASSEYRAASNSFLRASASVAAVVEFIAQAEPPPPDDDEGLDLSLEAANALTYVNSLKELADFLGAMHAGRYEDALRSGESMTRLADESLRTAVELLVPERIMDARKAELALMRGWLAWARAEKAIDDADWDECHSQIDQARKHWSDGSAHGHRSALPSAEAIQAQMGTFEMLLQSTLRRLDSELRRVREVAELRSQRDEAMSRIGTRVDQIFTGPVQRSAIGRESAVNESRVTIEHSQATDLATLARQLGDLRDPLAEGAGGEAAAAVAAAHDAAKAGDEGAAIRHLEGAGRQARELASMMGLAAVEQAFQRAAGG